MNKQEKQELQEQREHYARQIHAIVTEQGGTFEVVIHKTSESNLTWYYSVNLWYFDDKQKRVRSWCLNYVLSQYLDFGTLKNERHLKGLGVGTERSFEVIYNLGAKISKALNFDSFGEDITARYGVEYQENPYRYYYIYTDKATLVC